MRFSPFCKSILLAVILLGLILTKAQANEPQFPSSYSSSIGLALAVMTFLMIKYTFEEPKDETPETEEEPNDPPIESLAVLFSILGL